MTVKQIQATKIQNRNAKILRSDLGIRPTADSHAYRALLQDITCERYASRAAALAHIEAAFEDCLITPIELRKLEAALG